MFVIDREGNRAVPLQQKTFSELGVREREHLQEWIAQDPVVLGEELLIIQKEFAGFSDTLERLDLLAVDRQGNLVVIENKLDDSGRDVTWQALKYASYCSSLTKEQVRSVFQEYLQRQGSSDSAEDRLTEFFSQEYEELELNQGQTQRIILIAANFRKEVTSTVLWLLNYRLRIQCFKVIPYVKDEDLFISLEQIIPMRDAEEYIISMAAKTQDEAEAQETKKKRHAVRREFWTELLRQMNRKSDLFQTISPGEHNWISTGAGTSGTSFNFVASRDYGRVELYLNRSPDENATLFDLLRARKDEIEAEFEESLIWDSMDGQQACRIKCEREGDLYDPERWPEMIEFMTNAMMRLIPALKRPLDDAVRTVRSGGPSDDGSDV